MPKRVHKYGAKVFAQIYHCGRQTNSGAIPGMQARSSSRTACPFSDLMPEPFTTEEVKAVVKVPVTVVGRINDPFLADSIIFAAVPPGKGEITDSSSGRRRSAASWASRFGTILRRRWRTSRS